MRTLRVLAPAILAFVVACLAAAGAAAQTPGSTVVARGLDNPRGLTFGSAGGLYIAEAGRGGSGPCIGQGEMRFCYGSTGAVTAVVRGRQYRLATGLPSVALANGVEAVGPADLSSSGPGKRLQVVIGWIPGGTAASRAALGRFGQRFARLVRLTADPRESRFLWDLGAFEAAANPDGAALETNPWALVSEPQRNIVVDAAGNSLLLVPAHGPISTLATFAPRPALAPPFLGLPPGAMIPMDSVPDSITRGPDGAYYVGELTGFPFPVGAARVYRVVPGQAPTVFAEGFTNIIDLAFDRAGNLYVLEHTTRGLLSRDPAGAVVRVAANGTRTTVASAGLVNPTGLAIGPDGALYVSNRGTSARTGEVLRISLG